MHCYDSGLPRRAGAERAATLIDPPTTRRHASRCTGDWANNYMTVTEEMNCSNVAASKLLEFPAGIRVHGGGKLIEPDGPEATLIKMWISAAVTRRLAVGCRRRASPPRWRRRRAPTIRRWCA